MGIVAQVPKTTYQMFSDRCLKLGLDLEFSLGVALSRYRQQPGRLCDRIAVDTLVGIASQAQISVPVPMEIEDFIDWRGRFQSNTALESVHVNRALTEWSQIDAVTLRGLDERSRLGLSLRA